MSCTSALSYAYPDPLFCLPSRGVRTEFRNPHYDERYPETGVAPSTADDPSKLPVEHADFAPEEHCPPTLLFPESRSKGRRTRRVTQDCEPEAKPSSKRAATSPPDSKDACRESEQDAKKDKGANKGKQKAKAAKSEWDTTDEEDNAEEEQVLQLPRTPPPRRSPRLARRAAVTKLALKDPFAPLASTSKTKADTRKEIKVKPTPRITKVEVQVTEVRKETTVKSMPRIVEKHSEPDKRSGGPREKAKVDMPVLDEEDNPFL